MKTFVGQYKNGSFVYSGHNDAIKAQLISILNTPMGSRFYAPSYGSHLNEYRFSILNYFTINMIAQEIKNAIQFMGGVTLASMNYFLKNNQLHFIVELAYLSEIVRVELKVVDGVAS